MKRLFIILVCWVCLIGGTKTPQKEKSFTLPILKPLPIKKVEIKIAPHKIEIKGRNEFLNAIGHQESGNRYYIVNRYGYMGKYQFGKSTLKTLKIKTTKTEFLNNPELQEKAMIKLLKYNKKRLQKYINKFDRQVINGILITESGLLAAAHLGGAGSVKKWFRTGKIKEDANGIKITQYMKQFSGYNLYL